MELDQQLKDLSQKYLFESTQYQTDGQSPNLEVCLQGKPHRYLYPEGWTD